MTKDILITNLIDQLPQIAVANDAKFDQEKKDFYQNLIKKNLVENLPESFFNLKTVREKIKFFEESLPIVKFLYKDVAPCTLSLVCIHKYRIYSSKFIYDMISRWLIPGKHLNISLSYGSDFEFVERNSEKYILMEILLDIDSYEDLKTIKRTLPMISSEIRVGITSIEQGMRILEMKGLNVDEKMSLVQDYILHLMSRKSVYFDRDLFVEMQHFFVFSSDKFKTLREYRHMTRIICWQYLFHKAMSEEEEAYSTKRQIRIKIMKTRLQYPYGVKVVLGVLVGLSYLRENESFGEKQIIKSIQACIPNTQLVPNSYLPLKRKGEETPMIYLEVEKDDGRFFSRDEVNKLQAVLPEDLKDRIEQLMHPIFMPRNEEEIMRNILSLSKQLKAYDDIPQIIISFDKQAENHIFFVIILLRVVKNEDLSVQEVCFKHEFKYEFIPDRIKIMGQVKKKHFKEANVFYVKLNKNEFLRKDHSLDLYRARQAVLDELYHVFSNVRDYNGGMIAKENEMFNTLKKHLAKKGPFNELLLENFFYSLSPVIVRSMIDVKLLETSFDILLDILEDNKVQNEGYLLKISFQNKYIFTYIASQDSSFQDEINQALTKLKLTRFQLVSSFINVEETYYLGYIFHAERQDERKKFCDTIRASLDSWQQKHRSI